MNPFSKISGISMVIDLGPRELSANASKFNTNFESPLYLSTKLKMLSKAL